MVVGIIRHPDLNDFKLACDGSVRQDFDNSGTSKASVDYDAFGGALSGVLVDRYGYTGREWVWPPKTRARSGGSFPRTISGVVHTESVTFVTSASFSN